MNTIPTKTSTVIIGGGVMGASTAYHLALRGVRDIILLERDPFFGQGATGKCAGGIRYQFSTAINVALSQLSLPMLERFEAETGQAIDLQWPGYLIFATREADVPIFHRNIALQNSMGVPTEWLDKTAVSQRIPQLITDDILGASFHAGDGLADPNGVVAGYISAARRLGVTALTETAVIGIEQTAGKVTAVQTAQGRIECETVVNAAGPWAGQISEMMGVTLPLTAVRRQIVTTTPVPSIARDLPFVIDFATGLYFHREGEGVLTGMGNPDQAAGFDETVDVDWEDVHLDAAIARFPLLAQAGLLANWAGLYENTPDAHPIIGAVEQVDGYFVVTGFSGHGFMHGPAAGLLLAEIMLDGRSHTLDISSLGNGRFAAGKLIKEYNVI